VKTMLPDAVNRNGLPKAPSVQFSTELFDSDFQQNWYVAYTRANHERTVTDQLGERGIESFLPQYESVRKWKDRRVCLHLPLFPGYVFVRFATPDRLRVQQTRGLVQLVSFGGSPTPVPETEIQSIREILTRGLRPLPHPFLRAGRRIRIRSGPLAGLDGILVRRKNRFRFVVSVALILRSMSVEVDEADLVAL
jgi:transcription antitermination factor NusG